MMWNAQARAVTVCFGLVGLFSVYSFRLIDLQIVQHEKFTTLAAEKHNHKQIIYARRGIIRDAHGEPLAENIPVKTVVADASHIRDPVAVAAAIADQLEMDPRDVADRLKQSGKGSKHIVLKAEIPELTAERIKESLRVANLRGIYFDQDFVRVYPNGQMLSQVIGFVDHEHKGTMGIERTMQDFLEGTDGFRYIETDRTGKELVPYRGQESSAKDGCDVKLTVDLSLQNILETELDASIRWRQSHLPQGGLDMTHIRAAQHPRMVSIAGMCQDANGLESPNRQNKTASAHLETLVAGASAFELRHGLVAA